MKIRIDFDALQDRVENLAAKEASMFAQYLQERGAEPPSEAQIAMFIKLAAFSFRTMLEEYHRQLLAQLGEPTH